MGENGTFTERDRILLHLRMGLGKLSLRRRQNPRDDEAALMFSARQLLEFLELGNWKIVAAGPGITRGHSPPDPKP